MRAADRALPLLRAGVGLRFAFLATDTGDDPDGVARRYPRHFLDRTIADAVALSEVLFWMETGGVAAVAAEDRAAVEARLRKRLERIGDGDVKAHFMRAFRDRLWRESRRRSSVTNRPRAVSEKPAPVNAKAAEEVGRPAVAAAERTLLAVLLNWPATFSEFEEELGSLVFSTPGLERLRQHLVGALSGEESPSVDELIEGLQASGFRDVLDDLKDDLRGARNLSAHTEASAEEMEALARGEHWAQFAAESRANAPDASAEGIKALWRQNLALIKTAKRMDEDAPGDDEAMARRRLLKLAELGEADGDERD
jgi:DNA primase